MKIMTDTPFISVITPTLNRASLIERTIQSVINQGYANYEHIIVDGLSTDGTLGILNKYKNIKTYSFNCSATEAQNFGIVKSKGDLICFVNSDDYLLSDAFHTMGMFFSLFKEARMFTGSFIVEEQEKIIYKAPIYHSILDLETLAYGAPGINTTFFKKEIFEQYGQLRHDLTIANDRGFIAELILGGEKSVTVPKHVLAYLKHGGSGTINANGKLDAKIIQEHIKLSHELILRAQKRSLKRFFQAWNSWEKAKNILCHFQKRDFKEALKNTIFFLLSKEIFIFLIYSLPFYSIWKIKFNVNRKIESIF